MQTFTDQMTTRCVGRFLIDVPANATDISGSYGFQVAALGSIKRSGGTMQRRLEQLDQLLNERTALAVGQKDAYGKPMPDAKIYLLGSSVRSIRYSGSNLEYDPIMDGYVVRSDATFSFKTNAYGEERVKEFNDFLSEIAAALTVRENSVIPNSAGFCIDNGFVAMNSKRRENAAISWVLPGHPDVKFSFSTQSNDDAVRPGHLDRESETIAELGNLMSSIHALRKRRFEIIGMPAQEWSVEFTDQPALEFRIEIPGSPHDKAKPFITLAMWVGDGQNKIKPSLTKGEALALWDAVIQTLRLRPGAV